MVLFCGFQDVEQSEILSSLPTVFGVAEGTAQVAPGEPDEMGGLSLPETLSLDGGEYLSDLQNRWPRHPLIPRR